MIPSRSFEFRGVPIVRAPGYLRSYLDCVDGAVAVGGSIAPDGQRSAIWALYRKGEVVAQITVDVETGDLR